MANETVIPMNTNNRMKEKREKQEKLARLQIYLRTYCFSYFIDNVKSHFRKASHPKNMPSGSKKSHRRRALLILLHPLHEEVWDPKSQEQIPGALLFLAMVLAKLDEVIDIRMPRLQIPQHI